METQRLQPPAELLEPRLGLRWKIAAGVFALGLLNVALAAFLGRESLLEQQEAHASGELNGFPATLEVLISSQITELARLGSELAITFDPVDDRSAELIAGSASLFANLTRLQFFERQSGLLMGGWTLGEHDAVAVNRLLDTLVSGAVGAGAPVAGVVCESWCEHIVALPAYSQSAREMVVVVGTDLFEILPLFQRLTGGDIAIALNQNGRFAARDVKGVTNAASMMPVVRSAVPRLVAGGRVNWVGARGRHFRAITIPVPGLQASRSVWAVMLLDETESLLQIERAAWIHGLTVAAVMLVSVGLLILLISPQFARLATATTVLPMLARQQFSVVRRRLVRERRREVLRDEVDALLAGLGWLSHVLERDQGAEAASEAKSRVLDHMSHEIRTPFTGLVGVLELLEQTTLDSDQRRLVRMVRDSADALLTLINQILDYSRIEAGEMSLENVEFSAGEVLEKVAETVSSAALAKNVRLVVLVDAQVPDTVRGDALKLRQILINLASNAVRFTARGRVELSLSVAEDDAAVLLFSVRDTGIGIPEDARQRLFERFTRADVATNCRYGGSGLGLSISQGLAELLGGRLELDSELGKGSVFRLCLPCETLKPAKPSRELVGLDVRLCGDDLRELACWGGVLARAGAHVHPEGTGAVAVEVRGDALGARIEVGGRLQIGLSRPIRLLDLISSVRRAADPDQVAAVPQAGLQAVLSGTAKQILPAPAAPAAGCPVDEDMIRSVLGDSPAHRQKVFNEFLRVNGDLLDQLSAAGEAGEIARLRDLAHRMLGSARVLGAGPLIAALESLEDAREGDAALAGQLIAARQAYDALARWLAVELAPAI